MLFVSDLLDVNPASFVEFCRDLHEIFNIDAVNTVPITCDYGSLWRQRNHRECLANDTIVPYRQAVDCSSHATTLDHHGIIPLLRFVLFIVQILCYITLRHRLDDSIT